MAKHTNLITTLDDCYNELKKDGITLQSKYNFIYKNKALSVSFGL